MAEEDNLSLQIGEPRNQGFDKSGSKPRFVRAIAGATLGGAGICINEVLWYFNLNGGSVFFALACFLLIMGVGMIISVFAIKPAPPPFEEKQLNENGAISLKTFFVTLVILASICSGGFLFFNRALMLLQTGADRLGQCQRLEDALMSLGSIPPSAVSPARGAIGCGSARYGIFFRSVNNVNVYGITSRSDQDRVLRKLSELATKIDMAPTKVFFYEKENWIEQRNSNGSVFGHRGSESLLRIAVVR